MDDEVREGNQDGARQVSPRRNRSKLLAAPANPCEARDIQPSPQTGRWRYTSRKLLSELFKPQKLPSPEAVTQIFECTRSLVSFANKFNLNRGMAISALAKAGIDIRSVVAREW